MAKTVRKTSRAVAGIIDAYVAAKRAAFKGFMDTAYKLFESCIDTASSTMEQPSGIP